MCDPPSSSVSCLAAGSGTPGVLVIWNGAGRLPRSRLEPVLPSEARSPDLAPDMAHLCHRTIMQGCHDEHHFVGVYTDDQCIGVSPWQGSGREGGCLCRVSYTMGGKS